VVARKLKVVKEEIRECNKEVFGDVKIRKYNLVVPINILDVKENLLAFTRRNWSREDWQ